MSGTFFRTFQFDHVGPDPLRRHFELAVGVSDEASNASIFVADGKVNPAAREADLRPGHRLRPQEPKEKCRRNSTFPEWLHSTEDCLGSGPAKSRVFFVSRPRFALEV